MHWWSLQVGVFYGAFLLKFVDFGHEQAQEVKAWVSSSTLKPVEFQWCLWHSLIQMILCRFFTFWHMVNTGMPTLVAGLNLFYWGLLLSAMTDTFGGYLTTNHTNFLQCLSDGKAWQGQHGCLHIHDNGPTLNVTEPLLCLLVLSLNLVIYILKKCSPGKPVSMLEFGLVFLWGSWCRFRRMVVVRCFYWYWCGILYGSGGLLCFCQTTRRLWLKCNCAFNCVLPSWRVVGWVWHQVLGKNHCSPPGFVCKTELFRIHLVSLSLL